MSPPQLYVDCLIEGTFICINSLNPTGSCNK